MFGVATCLVTAGAAWSAALNVGRANAPTLVAHGLFNDSLAALILLDDATTRDAKAIEGAEVPDLISRALRDQALNPRALHVLALRASAKPDAQRSLALARLSERLSRRDLLTQIILIEYAAEGDSPEKVLAHYNRALLTKRSARDLLFPVLRTAVADDAIRAALRPYIDPKYPWAIEFLRDCLGWGVEPRLVVDLLLPARTPERVAQSDNVSDLLIQRLVERADFATAGRYYQTLPGAQPGLLQSTGFDDASVDVRRVPLSWKIVDGSEIDAAFERDNAGVHSLHIFAGTANSGIALRKLMYLQPGTYTLSERRQIIAPSDHASVKWSLTCVTATTSSKVWEGASTPGGLPGPVGPIVVPSGCPHQLLELSVAGGESQSGLELRIDQLKLVRAAN